MKKIILLLGFIYMLNAQAEIKVAFFRCYDWYGNLIQFEENGQFCHVAIEYQGGWVHAHPQKGVIYQQNLYEVNVGVLGEVIVDSDAAELQEEQVEPWMGLPYDSTFKWNTNKATYCSKLVGQFLNISPKIMTFTTPYWKNYKNLPQNELGISPDRIYSVLKKRKYD